MRKRFLGFGEWYTEHLIDLNQVEAIDDEKKSYFTGKVMVIYYWLRFNQKNGSVVKFLTKGWSASSLREFLHFVGDTWPNITINTQLKKDSSLKISGLQELLEKK